MTTFKAVLFTGASALMIAAPAYAMAQTAAPAASGGLETVVVTARKRSEDLLKIPVSVSSLTAQALQTRGIETLDDVAFNTPGMADNQASGGSARSDRSFQSIIIRGMTPSTTTQPTTSIFINGTPVASSDMLQNLDNVDHVEVLKGPQSAYFGRETFAGAVNVVSAAPTNRLTANFEASAGTRNTYTVSGDVSGPLVKDMLMASFGGRYDTHDGSYKNAYNPSQTLGNQSTRSLHAALTFKPTSDLTIKAFGLMVHDDDGPPATGVVLATGRKAQSNCVVNNVPFFCGTIPSLNYGVTPSQNTTPSALLSTFLAAPHGIVKDRDTVQHFGLVRDASHVDMTIEYVAPNLGLTFTDLFAYNYDQFSEMSDLSDLDSQPNGNQPGYSAAPYGGFDYSVQGIHNNISEEFRVQSDVTKPYRALVGVSYIDTHDNQAINSVVPLAAGPSRSTTSGVFFSLAYDVLPKLTINFDGRYQSDTETAFTPTYGVNASGTSTAFLPRVSAQYKFTPDAMAYFTYSEGVNPGVFNTTYGNLPAASQAEIKAVGYNIGIATLPEHITNYELGFKAKFLDGRANISADIYYDEWTNQLNAVSYTFGLNDPANPINIPGSNVYNPKQPAPDPISFTANNAATNPKGVEFEGNLIPVDHVTLNVSAAYNDTRYTNFVCGSCTPYPVTYSAAGKYLPFAPLFSATVGAQYDNTITAFARPMDWFARIDYIHRDGVYLQASNTVKTPSTELVNVRGGIKLGQGFTIEGYINNLTNEKSPIGGFSALNFTTFAYTAFDLTLPNLMTGGVTLRYKY